LPAEQAFDYALKNVGQCESFVIAHFVAKKGKNAKHINLLVPFKKGADEV